MAALADRRRDVLLAPADYVPLDRRFERFAAADATEHWAEALAERGTPRDWNWLRARSRVVALLAQAGSGKTVEFMRQVDEARAAGRDAFFFRVERLCSGTLADAHETAACQALFKAWLSTGRPAELFLDSVDEAKLPQARTSRPLRDALRTVGLGLNGHLHRVSAFVSCRSSEWFEDVEQKALGEFAASIARPAEDAAPIEVFDATFAPLDVGRIRLLARDRGGEAAVQALTEAEAIADVVTPLDAVLYLETYQSFAGTPDLAARFASRGALLDTSVRRRLAERGGEARRSMLEPGAALRAARFLAFACVVAQTFDLAIGGARPGCVDPEELLAAGHAALSPDGIRQLLACPLFVPAGQAKVRFYRREARDILAAQWLRDRIAEGASATALGDRFIRMSFGAPRVPVVHGSMLAWLSSYDPTTLRRMIQAAPHWIIEDGDPRSLALEDRVSALSSHLRLGPHRFHGEFTFDVGELRRFSRPELEDAIVGHLAAPPPGDLFDHLMQMTEAGRYPSAAAPLVAILKDPTRSAGDRMFAVRALIACGGEEHLRDVALHVVAIGVPDGRGEPFANSRRDHFIVDLVTAAYPRAIGVADALALLGLVRGKDYSHEAKEFASWLAATAPRQDLEAWTVGLDGLCFDAPPASYKPFRHEIPPLLHRAKLLLRGLLEIAARYLREVDSADLTRDIAIYDHLRRADQLGASFSMSRRGSPVPAAMTAVTAIRRAVFEELARAGGQAHTAFAFHEHLDWTTYTDDVRREDMDWLLARHRKTDGAARRDYADAAVFLAERSTGVRRAGARLRIALAAVAGGQVDRALLAQVTTDPLLAPWRRRRALRQWRDDEPNAILAKASAAIAAVRSRLRDRRDFGAIRAGEAVSRLADLVLGAGYVHASEAELVKRHGARLGAAAIEGARAFARSYRPVDRGRRVLGTDILAQAGYAYERNADPTMTGLEPAAALHAALLFATDWPEWASDLARTNPDTWSTLAVPLIAAELREKKWDDPTIHHRFLSVAAHLDEEIQAPLSAPLLAAITAIPIIDGLDIDRVARILRADAAVARRLPQLAAHRARESWYEGSTGRALGWLPAWAEGDAAALDTLLAWMRADHDLIPEGLGIFLRAHGRELSAPPPALATREAFADLAYSCIRPADDTPHREGVHSVGERENLQHLRSEIGDLLAVDFDDAEREALERLLRTHVVPVSAGWADRWRGRYAQQAVRPRPWSGATIAEWGEELATAPATGGELQARLGEMIAEIERDLASSDFDRRGLFSSTILESDFRAWLGHALDERRRPWFSIVQEAETAAAKRTDLRVELRRWAGAVVVVEIKLLHGWEYVELVDKFRSQLVDQYLLTPRSQHGIYLIVDLGRKAKGAMPDGSTPAGAELVAIINDQSPAVLAEGGQVVTAQLFRILETKRSRRMEASAAKKPPKAGLTASSSAKAPPASAGRTGGGRRQPAAADKERPAGGDAGSDPTI